MNKIKRSEIDSLNDQIKTWRDNAVFWEEIAKKHSLESDYYQKELERSHTLLGRVIHQLSERWDTVRLTKYFPTDNLHGKKTLSNPGGE